MSPANISFSLSPPEDSCLFHPGVPIFHDALKVSSKCIFLRLCLDSPFRPPAVHFLRCRNLISTLSSCFYPLLRESNSHVFVLFCSWPSDVVLCLGFLLRAGHVVKSGRQISRSSCQSRYANNMIIVSCCFSYDARTVDWTKITSQTFSKY